MFHVHEGVELESVLQCNTLRLMCPARCLLVLWWRSGMADSLGEGSEGVIFDQTSTRSCSIQKSHLFEVEVWLGRGILVLWCTAGVSLQIYLLQKQGVEDCSKERNFAVFQIGHMTTPEIVRAYTVSRVQVPTHIRLAAQFVPIIPCAPSESPNWSIWVQNRVRKVMFWIS